MTLGKDSTEDAGTARKDAPEAARGIAVVSACRRYRRLRYCIGRRSSASGIRLGRRLEHSRAVFLNRGMWAATLPQDAALSTGLESYRREVERRVTFSVAFCCGLSRRWFSQSPR